MATVNENVRYEPDEHPPPLVTFGAGAQAALITLAPIVLTVVIVVRIADGTDSYHVVGCFCCAGGERHHDGVAGGAGRADRVGAHPDDGDVGGVHRGVRGSLGRGRGVDHGELGGDIVAVPVPAGGASFVAAADIHAGGFGHGNHANRGYSHAHRVRHHEAGPGRGVRERGAAGCGGYAGGGNGTGVAGASGLAAVVAGHRHRGGLRRRCALRAVRHRPSGGCRVGGCAHRFVARFRPDAGGGVLGVAARVRGGDAGGGYRDGGGRGRNPAGVAAQREGDGFPGGAGGVECGRGGEPAVGNPRHTAQYDLLVERVAGGNHGNRGAAAWGWSSGCCSSCWLSFPSLRRC